MKVAVILCRSWSKRCLVIHDEVQNLMKCDPPPTHFLILPSPPTKHKPAQVLTDPASPGVGGNPNEPLLLVQKLALDETDAIFGAFESSYRRHATDAGGWSPEPGGFNRWLDTYHHAVLRKTRPVIVTVHVSVFVWYSFFSNM